MKVKRISPAGVADVYNMEVADTHDFAVNECGVIVHNCYDMARYVCMKNPISPRPRAKSEPLPYDPLDLNQNKGYDSYEYWRRY